jgi:hypothetical protein
MHWLRIEVLRNELTYKLIPFYTKFTTKRKQMAKAKVNTVNAFSPNPRKKRPGIHSKKKYSKLKSSKLYKKISRGQG